MFVGFTFVSSAINLIYLKQLVLLYQALQSSDQKIFLKDLYEPTRENQKTDNVLILISLQVINRVI
jgi:hypothetical protein